MRKLKHRDGNRLTQGHTVRKWLNGDLTSDLQDFKGVVHLITL